MKPHKFPEYQGPLKHPMPPPKKVKKLEKLKEKGLEVQYSPAPWFTDNVEALRKEVEERQRRIAEAEHADLLPEFPADRTPKGEPKVRYQRKQLVKNYKYL